MKPPSCTRGCLHLLVVALAFILGGSSGWALAVYTGQRPPTEVSTQAPILWQTFNLLQSEYYGRPVDAKELVYSAIRGMTSAVGDPYTVFLPPKEATEVRNSFQGNYEGVGIFVELRNGLPTVVSTIPDTPAERGGIRPGDAIVAVDGRPTQPLPLDQVMSLVRGPSGTPVTLTLQRQGLRDTVDVTLIRQKITAPALTAMELDGQVIHLRLFVFNDRTIRELDAALSQYLSQQKRGIILDLRNNGGGLVDAARQTLGRFLESGVAFYEDDDPEEGGLAEVSVETAGTQAYQIPLVVLVNRYTASAAEIVAGALQDHHRAILIGERTFGKGSVQRVHDFEDGSSLRITVAHWLTPSKRDITAQGIMPDILIPVEGDYSMDEDPHLQRALEYFNTTQ